jgi:hypothetical protein
LDVSTKVGYVFPNALSEHWFSKCFQ